MTLNRRECIIKCFDLIEAVCEQNQQSVDEQKKDAFWTQRPGLFRAILSGMVTREHIVKIIPMLMHCN